MGVDGEVEAVEPQLVHGRVDRADRRLLDHKAKSRETPVTKRVRIVDLQM
jgi:hypothetical protein